VPSGSFTVSCPKCQAIVAASGTPHDQSAMGVGNSPSTSRRRLRKSAPAPLFKLSPEGVDEVGSAGSLEANELALALIGLLKAEKSVHRSPTRPAWDRRRVLVCTEQKHRELIATGLTEDNYEVFVAEDTEQAIERMRESQVDVVLLDSLFDAAEQGAAFVTREVNVLRPADRRRLFFVSLSSSKRTIDGHNSFLNSGNLVINFTELADLPEILDRSLREFNELYKDFNAALNLAPI
jgi:CheY-like chemotaxis protein